MKTKQYSLTNNYYTPVTAQNLKQAVMLTLEQACQEHDRLCRQIVNGEVEYNSEIEQRLNDLTYTISQNQQKIKVITTKDKNSKQPNNFTQSLSNTPNIETGRYI